MSAAERTKHVVDLLWFDGCPNHEDARQLVFDVVGEVAPDASINDIDATDPVVAARLAFPGSPTVRVDGRDVQPGFEDPGEYTPRCRLYGTDEGFARIPLRAWIESALR